MLGIVRRTIGRTEQRMQSMQTSFQEFLKQKVEGSDWKDRKRLRAEWLGALNRLLDQIRDWLRESDPDGVLECVNYEVQRVEERLGVYDAPALKIRLNTEYAEVLPIGRFTPQPFAFGQWLLDRYTDLHFTNGRVDITNGERRHLLLRGDAGEGQWCALIPGRPEPIPFDRTCLEAILEDLLK